MSEPSESTEKPLVGYTVLVPHDFVVPRLGRAAWIAKNGVLDDPETPVRGTQRVVLEMSLEEWESIGAAIGFDGSITLDKMIVHQLSVALATRARAVGGRLPRVSGIDAIGVIAEAVFALKCELARIGTGKDDLEPPPVLALRLNGTVAPELPGTYIYRYLFCRANETGAPELYAVEGPLGPFLEANKALDAVAAMMPVPVGSYGRYVSLGIIGNEEDVEIMRARRLKGLNASDEWPSERNEREERDRKRAAQNAARN